MNTFPSLVLNNHPPIMKNPIIPLQPNIPSDKNRSKSPNNLMKRGPNRILTPTIPKLSQRRDMKEGLTQEARTPPKVPNLLGKGGLEENMSSINI